MSSRLRAGMAVVWSRIGARSGRSGLAAGGVIGLVAGLVLGTVALPLLRDAERLEPGELVIMSSYDESQGEQRQRLLDQWNAIHGKRNPASFRQLSREAEQAHLEMREAGPEIDIYNMDVTWTTEFATADRIRPLDRRRLQSRALLDGFLEEPLATCEHQGTLYALPFNTDAGLLYYRTFGTGDAGGRPGPDRKQVWPDPVRSWDEIGGIAAQAGGQDREPNLEAAYAAQLKNAEILTVTALEAIWAEGGDVVDDRGNVVIDSAAAERGLRRLRDGLQPGGNRLILADSRGFDEKQSTTAFGEGRVMFMRNWPVAYRDLQSVGTAGRPFHYAVTTVPGKASVLGGQNLAVARSSAQPRAAQALIEFLTGERSQQILFEHGGLAATREIVYRDQNITAKYGYAGTLLEAIRAARPRPSTPHYTDFSLEFRAVVLEVIDGEGEITADHVHRLTDALKGKRRR